MVVGAETGVGKSYFMLDMLMAAAVVGPALYVSVEDPPLEVGRRLASGLEAESLQVGFPDTARLSTVLGYLDEARRLKPALVAVDYLQLIGYDGPVQAWGKADAVSRTCAELKSAAKAGGFPLVLGSQLRRAMADERGAFPHLGRIKESGDVENQSEFVVMLGSNARGVRAEVLKAKSAPVGAFARYRRGAGGVLVEDNEAFGAEDT